MPKSTREQHKRLADALIARGYEDRAARLAELSRLAGRPVPAFAALDAAEAEDIAARLHWAAPCPR
jgi:hypothetical protein